MTEPAPVPAVSVPSATFPESIVSIGTGSNLQQADLAVGDVAAGNVVKDCAQVTVNTFHGTVVNKAARPAIERHPHPPRPPRPLRTFLDRQDEQRDLLPELSPGRGAWVHGPAGSGLSALLRQAANLPAIQALPDGVLLLSGDGLSPHLDDVVQCLFNAFYTSETMVHIAPDAARPYLNRLRALFVLDRLPLTSDDLVTIADMLADGTVLIAADGVAPDTLLDIPLLGLPPADAQQLFLRTAQSDLEGSGELIRRLCDAVDGMPLALTLCAHMVRTELLTLEQLVAQLEELRSEPRALVRALKCCLQSVGEPERALLRSLAAIGGPDVDKHGLEEISDLDPQALDTALDRLLELRLVECGNDRYSMATLSLRRVLEQLLKPDAERKRAAAFFAALLPAIKGDLARLAQEQSNLVSSAETLLAQGQTAQAGLVAQGVQPILTLGGQWERWGDITRIAEHAAEVGDFPALRAWALHERGTRAGLLGDRKAALRDLAEASRIRVSQGDAEGAALSDHNASLFVLPPPAPPAPPVMARRGASIAIPLAALAALLLWGAWRAMAGGLPADPTPIALVEPSATPTSTSAPSTTASSVPTATRSPSATPTTAPTETAPPSATPEASVTSEPSPTPEPSATTQPTVRVVVPTRRPPTRPPVSTITRAVPTREPTETDIPPTDIPPTDIPPTDIPPTSTPRPTATSSPVPRPTVDTLPPPAPSHVGPPDSSVIECGRQLTLNWEPVSDGSGIAAYEWVLEQALTGTAYRQIDTAQTTSISSPNMILECNARYRWRVRAIDGAGNVGAFSSFTGFSVAPSRPG